MHTCQTPYRAYRRALEAYRVPMFCAQFRRRALCVIHGENGDLKPPLHHLDEMGSDPTGSFFENLIPVCAEDNNEIEDNRKSGSVQLFRKRCLRPRNLLELSWDLYWEGQALRAYACARLGSFLAWRPARPGSKIPPEMADRNLPIELATQSILCLRVVNPEYAVPLAIDTLDRSILPHLEARDESHSMLDTALFSLAVAVGAFHRDYGDTVRGNAYFDLAEKYLERISTTIAREQRDRYENHRLINSVVRLEQHLQDSLNREEIRKHVIHSEYGNYPGGKLNVLYWKLREMRMQWAPDQTEEELKAVPLAFLKYGTERLRKSAWRKHVSTFSPILELEYIGIKAEACFNRASTEDAGELLRIAVEGYEDGHFAASHLPNSTAVENFARRYPNDFRLPFKYPWALVKAHFRTKKFGVVSFLDLSDRVLGRLLAYNIVRERQMPTG